VAFVAARLGIPATIFVPAWVDPVKLDGIVAAGADARREGDTFDESEARAERFAAETGRTYVSAYDDRWVLAGQGTLSVEIATQLAEPAGAIVVPLSGGGLVGGIAAAWRGMSGPAPYIVAASAERAAVMLASIRAGHPVELPEEETLANALAGGVGLENRHSFALVRKLVDEHVTVAEAEIAEAMRWAVARMRLVVEGGGAVALAALLGAQLDWLAGSDGPVVAVVSGGNVAPGVLARVLAGDGD
jgi:threonine dehydratase